MTQDEMEVLLKREFGSAMVLKFDGTDWDDALDEAERETGWSFPVTDNEQIKWLKRRATRHLFHYMVLRNAHKFRYEGIQLQQRFEHYQALVRQEDRDFEKFKDERPDLFAGVEAYELFGTQIAAGFQYQEHTGIDTTYLNSNQVIMNPSEEDG